MAGLSNSCCQHVSEDSPNALISLPSDNIFGFGFTFYRLMIKISVTKVAKVFIH
jgi:hypothetical protein